MKYIYFSFFLLLSVAAFGQASSAVDPFPKKEIKAKMKSKGDYTFITYKKIKLLITCKMKGDQIDSISSVQSKKTTLNRFDPSEKESVLELMKVMKYSGLDLFTRITDMYSTAADVEKEFQNIYPEYNDFIPNQYGVYNEGFCLVKAKGKYGFIDGSGHVVFDVIFDNASNFMDGKAYVKINGVWYLLFPDGKIILLN